MKKLFFLFFLILACNGNMKKSTNPQALKYSRPPGCVMPPHEKNRMKTVPRRPDPTSLPNRSILTQPNRAGAVTDFKVLVLLVDFPVDKPFTQSPAYFNELLFADTGETFKTYYKRQSYGAVNASTANLPTAIGVVHLPQPYSYYTGGNFGLNGAYPNNAQRMAQDAILAADPFLDFSQYDNDGDGVVDGVILVHAASGAELTGNPADIWSHAWSFPAMVVDGKTIEDYCTVPEYWTATRAMQIGVITHEAGHLYFNQIDEYGTSGTWQGLGRLCDMAGGSYNGWTGLGDHPAPFCAPSRVRAGFTTFVVVDTAGYYAVPLGAVLRYGTATENIYIEQRQLVNFDQPGSGLLFIHGKANISGMYYRWYPGLNADIDGWGLYQLIQADGLYELEHNTSSGDAEDYWPGPLAKTELNATTSPTSNFYSGLLGTPSGFNISKITNGGFILGNITPPPPPPDTVICPNDTTINLRGKGQKGKIVTYPGNCNPPSGFFFPIGITQVNCTNCSFTVTVTKVR